MTSTQVFDESDRYKVRLWKISDEVIRPLQRQILTWVTPDWDQRIEFLTYLENRNVEMSNLKRKFHPKHLDTLREDPTGVTKWDTYLIFLLLKHCGGGLADKDDIAWSSDSGKEPECIITSLKEVGIALAHEPVKLNQKEFFEKTEEIRTLMERALSSVGEICSHVSQTDIDKNVAKFNKKLHEIRDTNIAPKTPVEYKKESFFSEQIALIKNKGVPFLKGVLDRNTTLNPLSLMMKRDGRQVPVDEIFSEIQLEEDGENKEVLLEDLIEVASGTDAGSIILLKGHAGMGKSTLVKKITSDWITQKTSIKGLSSFDLLFFVELRDYFKTFHMLLECSLGKDVHLSFRNEDLVIAVLGLRILVILDGYDELNERSSELFQEVLSLNKLYSQLTLIVTTRPEAEEKLNAHLETSTLNAVHLRLAGIKAHKRREFVTKYFLSLPKDSPVLQELDELLEFLKKTGPKMRVTFEVTQNLCLLTTLWMFKPDIVNKITTEAELYWQTFLLSKARLEERLQRNQSTCHLELSILRQRTEEFLEELSRESLNGIKEDSLKLPQSVYQRLTDICQRLGLPVEELAGAFLKKITTSNDSFYTFPQKGLMELMGVYHIYQRVTRPDVDRSAMKEWSDELARTSIPSQIQSEMLSSVRSKRKPTVTDILKRLHGGSLPDSLKKYQNLLLLTLSVFHMGEVEVSEATKVEVMELLEKTGLRDKDSILKVMQNVKCNDAIARWIVQRYNLFGGLTMIKDSCIDGYNTLLAATDPPLPNRDEIEIDIDLEDTHSSLEVLSQQICRHRLYPTGMSFLHHFRGTSSPNTKETESIKNLLTKNCEKYRGIWSPTFQMPPNMRDLRVRLKDLHPSLDSFCESLEKTKKARFIEIHFSVNDVSSVSRPIPFLEEDPVVSVDVSDVKEEDIEKVGDILRALQPQDARRSFRRVFFPRCSLSSPEEFLRLLDSLKGVRVRWVISFPEDKEPDDEASLQEMRRRAEASTGCGDILWWDFE